MKRHLAGYIRPVLVLLVSVLGLCLALTAVRAEDKPVVLLIARGDAPYDGERSLKVAIDMEANTIISKLNALGYGVDVASEDGKDIHAGGSTLKVDTKLADVQIERYAGVIIPCMTTGTVPQTAVKIVQGVSVRKLPVAAQNSGVLVLASAGLLKGRDYAIGPEQVPIQDGVKQGVGVVRDGDILTSGVCPYLAQVAGLTDGTNELVATFAGMLKK
jgi:hypothetical protein